MYGTYKTRMADFFLGGYTATSDTGRYGAIWGIMKKGVVGLVELPCNVNPGLINHGLFSLGGTPPIVIIQYLNGTTPINQPFGVY